MKADLIIKGLCRSPHADSVLNTASSVSAPNSTKFEEGAIEECECFSQKLYASPSKEGSLAEHLNRLTLLGGRGGVRWGRRGKEGKSSVSRGSGSEKKVSSCQNFLESVDQLLCKSLNPRHTDLSNAINNYSREVQEENTQLAVKTQLACLHLKKQKCHEERVTITIKVRMYVTRPRLYRPNETVDPKTPATGFGAKIWLLSTHTPIESSCCGLFIDGIITLMF